MPQLLILSLQILYFCLAWLLVTFKISPFSNLWNIISSQNSDKIPDWIVHTHYLFALIFVTAGIAFTLRLKVMKYMNSTALYFLGILLATMAFSPDLYMINLLKYAYIVFIPVIFHRIMLQKGENIQKWIKASIQIALIYSTYHIAMYWNQSFILGEITTIALTAAITFIGIGTSITLYTEKYYKTALSFAMFIFLITNIFDSIEIFQNFHSIEYNKIPLIFISWSMIVFTLWVRKMLRTNS